MVMTSSSMVPLGTKAQSFTLYDTTSKQQKSLEALKSDVATVILFICNHCPFVKHIQTQLAQVAREYGDKGVAFIAISSNDVENYPEDRPELMAKEAREHGYSFPYLYDETQAVAKVYQAVCTPDIFVFDKNLSCVYRGQFDDSRPGRDTPITGADLTDALDQLLAGQPISSDQKPSIGCNIKWKE